MLSVMMRQADLWDIRPQGSNPCRNMRRYKTAPRERFLSLDELKRLGFVLEHAGDGQATAAIRLLGHRQRETTAIYAHLHDRALHEAGDMGFATAPPVSFRAPFSKQ